MAQAKLFSVQKVWLLIVAAMLSGSCWAATCDYPSVPITDNNPVYTYTFTISPKVAGTVLVDYMTDLSCPPYAHFSWDLMTGINTVGVRQNHPAYARITVLSADGTIPATSVVLYLNPPAPAVLARPNAPTGFKIL